jgi:NADH:ubiquinone oxidoreductase subunit 6 (subunit J)
VSIGSWIWTLFCIGSISVCAGALFLPVWWLMILGALMIFGSFALVLIDSDADPEMQRRWPHVRR